MRERQERPFGQSANDEGGKGAEAEQGGVRFEGDSRDVAGCGLGPGWRLAAFAEPSEDAPYSEAVDRLADQLQAASDLDDSLTYVNENGYEVRLDGDDAALPDDAAQGAARQSLPESYIAPYTSVKDQGVLESCCAFSAIASFQREKGTVTFSHSAGAHVSVTSAERAA